MHPNLFNQNKLPIKMKKPTQKTRYKIILGLMIISIIISAILSFIPLEQACDIGGGENSCVIVQTSDYEKTFGINNAHLGLIAFPIIAILTIIELKHPRKCQKKMIQFGITIGTMFAIYFLYVQLFILEAICKYCIVVDLAIIASLF